MNFIITNRYAREKKSSDRDFLTTLGDRKRTTMFSGKYNQGFLLDFVAAIELPSN